MNNIKQGKCVTFNPNFLSVNVFDNSDRQPDNKMFIGKYLILGIMSTYQLEVNDVKRVCF